MVSRLFNKMLRERHAYKVYKKVNYNERLNVAVFLIVNAENYSHQKCGNIFA